MYRAVDLSSRSQNLRLVKKIVGFCSPHSICSLFSPLTHKNNVRKFYFFEYFLDQRYCSHTRHDQRPGKGNSDDMNLEHIGGRDITDYQLENIYFENFTMNNENLIIKTYSITGYHWSSTIFFYLWPWIGNNFTKIWKKNFQNSILWVR